MSVLQLNLWTRRLSDPEVLNQMNAFHLGEIVKLLNMNPLFSGLKDSWLSGCSKVELDLIWLLRMPANKFWSQVLFDQSIQVDFKFCIFKTFLH